MNTSDMQTWVVAILVLVVVAVVVWLLTRQRRSKHLEDRFGPEYRRVVAERGDRTKAEAELLARERRVQRLKIVPLEAADAVRFSDEWEALQIRFVDDPRGAVADADRLVRELMTKRGYPMADFERRAEDISVDHPALVQNYRAAQAIALLNERGEANTEALRKAVVYYRDLFDELLETRGSQPRPTPDRNAQVQS